MSRAILLIAVFGVGYLLYKMYFKQLLQQGQAGKIKIGLIGLGIVFVILALSGRAPALFAVIGAAMTQVMRFIPLILRFAPSLRRFLGGAALGGAGSAFGGQGQGPQSSKVRTDTLIMTLDHHSGRIDGDVIVGEFKGRLLSALSNEELKSLYQHCAQADAEAARLLQAYITRERSDWSEAPASDSADLATGAEGISVREAYDILGLEQGVSRKEITLAHRGLISKMHPDKGGSTYLATKINTAKKVLIDHVKE